MVWNFDARGFGRTLKERREALGYSTRTVARLAGVSQSYVVALEGSRSSRDAAGPSPTIDVLVRLASAFGVEPAALLNPSLRSAGPHVLVVVEDDGSSMFDVTNSFVAEVDAVDTWVSAGRRKVTSASVGHIELRANASVAYDPDEVASAVQRGLLALAPTIEDRRVGLVFSEDPEVLLGATSSVLAIEHEWSEMVSQASWSAGAHPAWNLCVYEIDVLKRMPDPLAASLELIRCHETVWTTSGTTLHRNRAASLRLLQHMRPPRTRADHWREICIKQLDRISTN